MIDIFVMVRGLISRAFQNLIFPPLSQAIDIAVVRRLPSKHPKTIEY